MYTSLYLPPRLLLKRWPVALPFVQSVVSSSTENRIEYNAEPKCGNSEGDTWPTATGRTLDIMLDC